MLIKTGLWIEVAFSLSPLQVKEERKVIKLHGHCQQKALSSLTPVKKVLTRLGGNEVHIIPRRLLNLTS